MERAGSYVMFYYCSGCLYLGKTKENFTIVGVIYRVRPKKRRKPYRRYLWLDLNKTKTGINHFKSTISTT
jgi:hypothetical protein